MNRSEENRVTAINASFYKNVFLLTQVIPPSFEFQQCFKKGMFNKPNTAGFLHVSQYLSVIYNEKLFKEMVTWPILCKRDELTYRSEMKNFFSVLSRDNSDINFPSILMSHLVQSGGIKFLIIIWKLSQLAFRAYIKREFQGDLLYAPYPGVMYDITVKYFSNIIAKKCNIVIKIHKETEKITDIARNFLENEIDKLNTCKCEIFDRKEKIKKLAFYTPAHSLVQERLADIEDSNIIEIWKQNISMKVIYLLKKNEELRELEKLCNRLCKLIPRITSNSEIFNADKFTKINGDNYLFRTPDIQHLFDNLYVDGSIVFNTLLSLLTIMCERILFYLNDVNSLNLLQCSLYIQNAHKNIKYFQTLFTTLSIRISEILVKEQFISKEIENIYPSFDMTNTFIMNRNIFLPYPRINSNSNKYVDYSFYEELCSSPKEGKYKHLFKRHKHKYRPAHELSVPLSDFHSSWNVMNGWLSPRAYFFKREQISYNEKVISPLYSRLLRHTKLRSKHSRENILYSPDPLNLTSKKRRQSISGHYTEKDRFNRAAKNLFNPITSSLSCACSDIED